MKSPAWILVPSVIILIYTYLILVPGCFYLSDSWSYVHKIELSAAAQEFVKTHTGKSAKGYIIHLFNYCEILEPGSKCVGGVMPRFYFDYSQILGLDETPQGLRFQRSSFLFTVLVVLSALTRIILIGVMVPFRLVQMRMRYDPVSLQSKFLTFRALFSLAYILAFIVTNLLTTVGVLHYKSYFYKGIYDLGELKAEEHTLSKSVVGFIGIMLILSYVELYPAITYMTQRPLVHKGYHDPADDPEAQDLQFFSPNGSSQRAKSFTTDSIYTIISDDHELETEHSSTRNSSSGRSTYQPFEDDDDDDDDDDKIAPSLISEDPSLHKTISGSTVSDVSTTRHYNMSASSAAPSIRTMYSLR